jgi:patatin-like phospholipase/acyl hydrolase
MGKYRIVSIDGGGVRGILAARILQRLDAFCPGIFAQTDLFAGTSAGAIIAAGLANGIGPASLVELFRSKGGLIFRDGMVHRMLNVGGLVGAKYASTNCFEALYPVFGDIALKDLRKKVLIASFRLDAGRDASGCPSSSWKPKLFHNFEGIDSDGAQRAVDVVMRSAAAPTYFPIYQGYIDGGVVANNPSMCALAQAIEPGTGGQDLGNVVMLSISTGTKPQSIDSHDGNWGLAQWGFKIVDLLLEAGPGLADFQCQQLLRERYLRIDLCLPELIALDDVGQMENLIELADDADLHLAAKWLKDVWR